MTSREVVMMREKERQTAPGGLMLLVFLVLLGLAATGFVEAARAGRAGLVLAWLLGGIACMVGLGGLFVVNPNQARVLQLFGAYRGTAKTPGLRWANPFYSKRPISLRVR